MIDVFCIAHQMSAAAGNPVAVPPVRRSRLAGVMRDCGSSKAVLDYLREAGEYRRAFEIRQYVRRSHAAVSWALIFLRRVGAIECAPDVVRHSRYLRYRALK